MQAAERAEKCHFLSLQTFKLAGARNQTRLPCEFDANPFSGCQYISYTNKKITD